MSFKSAEDRLAKYVQAMERNHADWSEQQKQCVVAKTGQAFRVLVEVEDRVRGILARAPVISADYAKYHAFARSVTALVKRFSSQLNLKTEVLFIRTKWLARGCQTEVLDRILVDVFDLGWILQDNAQD